jgi:glycosyltransferase involved in cell wall biosynthesis
MAESSDPRITIGITAWREGDKLRQCWQSVLAQTDPRWEAVLVLDGGADEATRAVYDALTHSRLRKEAAPDNRGPYPNRNRAFALSATPLHFYLDADDQLVPDSVKLVLATFDAHPDADIVYGDYQNFGSRDDVSSFPRSVTWDDFALGQPLPGPCAYRVSLWQRFGGYAAELARGNGDYEFHIAAAEAGSRAVHCGAVFYRYHRTRGLSVSSSYNRRYHETHQIMVDRHPEFFADPRRRARFLGLAHFRTALAQWGAGERRAGLHHLAVALWGNRLWRDPGVWRYLLNMLWNMVWQWARRA